MKIKKELEILLWVVYAGGFLALITMYDGKAHLLQPDNYPYNEHRHEIVSEGHEEFLDSNGNSLGYGDFVEEWRDRSGRLYSLNDDVWLAHEKACRQEKAFVRMLYGLLGAGCYIALRRNSDKWPSHIAGALGVVLVLTLR